MPSADSLSRREREIMDVLFRLGEATVSEVLAELAAPPSYSAVRATLGILKDKERVRRRLSGRRYVYSPTVARGNARRAALRHLLSTFFDGSAEQAVTALLDLDETELGPEELERLRAKIERAKKEGR